MTVSNSKTDKEQMELDNWCEEWQGLLDHNCGSKDCSHNWWPKARQALLDWRDKAVSNARLDELERIDKANTGNEINFWFKEAQDAGLNNGWRTMKQYTQERTKALQSSQRPAEKEADR